MQEPAHGWKETYSHGTTLRFKTTYYKKIWTTSTIWEDERMGQEKLQEMEGELVKKGENF